MPAQLYISACAAAVLTLGIVLARSFWAHFTVVATGFLVGVAWVFIFAALQPYIKIVTDAIPTESGLFALPKTVSDALGGAIDHVFPSRLSPFLRALTIADSYDLTRDTALYTALGVSGIAHIASVSGMHVSFLVSMLGVVVRGRRALIIVSIPMLVFFMALTGFNAPVCRAVVMYLFVFASPLVKRRSDGITSVLAALLLILIVNPLMIAKVSLQLSFLSTLGIVTITPRIQSTLNAFGRRQKLLRRSIIPHRLGMARVPTLRSLYNVIAANVAASVGALTLATPLIAYYFGYVSVLAPITNLLTVWAAAYAFCGAIIAALLGLCAAPIGIAAAHIAAVPTDWILICARAISRLPFAAMYVSNVYILTWLAYVYAVFVAFFALRRHDKTPLRNALRPVCGSVAMLCLALLLTSLMPRGGLSVTAIDVGQGQSLVLTDGAATAVIDCGGSFSAASKTAAYLQAEADENVEFLILTHFHSDHTDGVIELMTRVNVETLIIPAPQYPDALNILGYAEALGTRVILVYETTEITFGSSTLTIFPPYDEGDNEGCITILASNGSWDALITGDMPSATELLLLEFADLPDVELFIAGHHGSRHSSSEDLLDAVLPEQVIISVGAYNTYGHPAEDTLRRFEERGIQVYRTDLMGNVTIRAN